MGFARDRYDATYPGSQPITEPWGLYSWLSGTNGALQWRGTMEVRNVANQPVTTAFPIRETVQDWKPGTYFVVAWNAAQPPARTTRREEEAGRGPATGMWVMDTDIALTTFTGDDGLNVFARSLQTAQPLAGLEVTLLSRGNEPMAKAITDEAGATVRRRPAQGPRCCPRRRRDGVRCGQAGLQPARARQDAVRLLRPRRHRARPARSGRCLPLHRARRLPPRRDGAAHGHAARCLGHCAGQRAGDADRQAPGRQRIHPLQPGPAGAARCTSRSPCRNPRAAAAGRSPPTSIPRRRRSAASNSRSRTSCPRSSRSSSPPTSRSCGPARSTPST